MQEKTGGNPFFGIQFFTALAEGGLLAFDPVAAAWRWDIKRIRAKSYTDNVVDLMAGKLRRSRTAAAELEETIFEIANHFDRGVALITAPQGRVRVAQLNLIVGKRAKISTAYASALRYFVADCALLAEDSWEQRYALTLAPELQRAECEFLTGDFAAAEERLSMLSHLVDRAAVTRLQTELYTTLDQSDRAVEVGLEYLRRVGVDWSPHRTKDEVRQEAGDLKNMGSIPATVW